MSVDRWIAIVFALRWGWMLGMNMGDEYGGWIFRQFNIGDGYWGWIWGINIGDEYWGWTAIAVPATATTVPADCAHSRMGSAGTQESHADEHWSSNHRMLQRSERWLLGHIYSFKKTSTQFNTQHCWLRELWNFLHVTVSFKWPQKLPLLRIQVYMHATTRDIDRHPSIAAATTQAQLTSTTKFGQSMHLYISIHQV